jgi:hypothetical protein
MRPREWLGYGGLAAIVGVLVWHFTNYHETKTNLSTLSLASVESFSATDLDGTRVEIEVSRSPVPIVLLAFKPDCRPCEDAIPWWNTMATMAGPERFRFYAVALGGSNFMIREYVSNNQLRMPVLLISTETLDRLHLHQTPTTVLIHPKDGIQNVWLGDPFRHRQEISAHMGIRLLPYPLSKLQSYIYGRPKR